MLIVLVDRVQVIWERLRSWYMNICTECCCWLGFLFCDRGPLIESIPDRITYKSSDFKNRYKRKYYIYTWCIYKIAHELLPDKHARRTQTQTLNDREKVVCFERYKRFKNNTQILMICDFQDLFLFFTKYKANHLADWYSDWHFKALYLIHRWIEQIKQMYV